jgi:transcriptional regulator with XRE-family HTH domain
MQRFGEKLRSLRQQHGLSYRKLAGELGVVHSHLAGIEANAHQPSAELVFKIARYFGVSTDVLMDDERDLD